MTLFPVTMRLLVLCLGLLAAVAAYDVPSRDQEPDPLEVRPFKMPVMMRQLCQSLRGMLEAKTRLGIQVHNSIELSHHFVQEFDTNSDKCISGSEIRDVAAHFRGNLAGYRTLFEHILDENRSGCVEAEEMSSLVKDCMMSAAGWREADQIQMGGSRTQMERIMEQTEPIKEDEEIVEETGIQEENEMEEEEGTDYVEEELTEENSEDRRAMIEQEKAAQKITSGLGDAIKEMICSLFRREHEEIALGVEKVMDALGTTNMAGFNYDEMFEFIGQVGIGRDEVNDLCTIMDENNDQFLSVEELMKALDNCPTPVFENIPIVNTRPMIPIDEIPCPSQAVVYKSFRARAMKFIGTRQIKFEGAPDAAREFYVSIAKDIENVITPQDMDIPLSCVQECWENIDANQDGFLDLFEFERLALDVFEEFLPRPERKNTVARIKLDKSKEVNLANIPRESLDMLAETAGRLFGELGLTVPEGDMDAVVGFLVKDSGVKAFLDKVQSSPKGVGEELEILAELIKPIIYQLQ